MSNSTNNYLAKLDLEVNKLSKLLEKMSLDNNKNPNVSSLPNNIKKKILLNVIRTKSLELINSVYVASLFTYDERLSINHKSLYQSLIENKSKSKILALETRNIEKKSIDELIRVYLKVYPNENTDILKMQYLELMLHLLIHDLTILANRYRLVSTINRNIQNKYKKDCDCFQILFTLKSEQFNIVIFDIFKVRGNDSYIGNSKDKMMMNKKYQAIQSWNSKKDYVRQLKAKARMMENMMSAIINDFMDSSNSNSRKFFSNLIGIGKPLNKNIITPKNANDNNYTNISEIPFWFYLDEFKDELPGGFWEGRFGIKNNRYYFPITCRYRNAIEMITQCIDTTKQTIDNLLTNYKELITKLIRKLHVQE